MEKKPVNANDEVMGGMIRALRQEPSAGASEAFMANVLATSTRRSNRIAKPALCATLAVATCIVFAMWPRETMASKFGRVIRAFQAEPFVHTRLYKQQANGEFVLEIERYQHGRDHRTIWYSQGSDRATVSGKGMAFFRSLGYGLVEKPFSPPPFPQVDRILAPSPAAKLLDKSDATWQGIKADVYRFEDTLALPSEGKLAFHKVSYTLYAEALTDRPLCLEEVNPAFGNRRIIWAYPGLDERLLQPNVPKGAPIFDIEQQQKSLLREIWKGGEVKEVAGVKVQFRAAIYDMASEELMIFTTGGEGRIIRAAPVLKVDGLPAGTENICRFSGVKPGTYEVADGIEWEGLRLLCEDVKFPKGTKIPNRFKVSVPVWKKDDSRLGRRFVGYAMFDVKKPIQTSRIYDLVQPQDVPIFSMPTLKGWEK